MGLVAGIVSLARVRVARRSATLDSARLRYAVRGLTVLATCTAVTVLMAGSGVLIALINPAAHHGLVPLGALILACAAVTTISAASVWQADRRLRALEPPPLTATGREALADLFGLIGEVFVSAGRRVPIAASLTRASSPSWQRAGRRALALFDPREHPWRYGCAVGLLAGAAIPLLDPSVLLVPGLGLVSGQLNGPNLSDLATTAPALIAIEFGLVLTGYASLGAYLGLRPRTRKTHISDTR